MQKEQTWSVPTPLGQKLSIGRALQQHLSLPYYESSRLALLPSQIPLLSPMEFAAAAVAFAAAASNIARACEKCYRAIKNIKHIHKDIEQYAFAADGFGCLVAGTGDTIDKMIDFKLAALEDKKIVAMIVHIHNMISEECLLVKDITRRLKELADKIPTKPGLSKYFARAMCRSEIKAIKAAICRFEPVKASIHVFASVMGLRLTCQQYKDRKRDGSPEIRKLEQRM